MKIVLEPNKNRSVSIFNSENLTPGTYIIVDGIEMAVEFCGLFNLVLKNNSCRINLSLQEVEDDKVNLMTEEQYYKSLLKLA